ncbi:MAG: cytochrome c5 family protein [Gammaproteobacteria bacterium]|nr:cytochrome c5 family protein [Gammaproteobacteria bacterium]
MKKLVSVSIATVALFGMMSTAQADVRTYRTACMSCHATGAAGAPKLGDKAAWKARIAAGMDTMVKNAIKGKGAMPPKGGRPNLTDEQIKAVVKYMVAESK